MNLAASNFDRILGNLQNLTGFDFMNIGVQVYRRTSVGLYAEVVTILISFK